MTNDDLAWHDLKTVLDDVRDGHGFDQRLYRDARRVLRPRPRLSDRLASLEARVRGLETLARYG